MANSRQAIKRARQAVKRRARALVHRTRFRTFQKRVLGAIAAGNQDEARAAFGKFASVADSAAGRGLVHRNKAARIKSRLSAAVRSLGSG